GLPLVLVDLHFCGKSASVRLQETPNFSLYQHHIPFALSEFFGAACCDRMQIACMGCLRVANRRPAGEADTMWLEAPAVEPKGKDGAGEESFNRKGDAAGE